MSSPSEPESEVEERQGLPLRHSRRAFSRTIVHLDKRVRAAPSKAYYKRLQEAGRVKQIAFTKNHSAGDIQGLLLANFPSLNGSDLSCLRFMASYSRGHSMKVVLRHIPSGAEIMQEYGGSAQKKIFIHWKEDSNPTTSASTTTSAALSASDATTSGTTSSSLAFPIGRSTTPVLTTTCTTTHTTTNPVSLPVTQPRPTDGLSTRRYLNNLATRPTMLIMDDSDLLQSPFESVPVEVEGVQSADDDIEIVEERELTHSMTGWQRESFPANITVVGTLTEDLSTNGLGSGRDGSTQTGRTEEVVCCARALSEQGQGTIPFITHSLEEAMWQAGTDAAILIIVMVRELDNPAKMADLMKILQGKAITSTKKCYFWIAKESSSEGQKVKAKYGLDALVDSPAMLVLAPSGTRTTPHRVDTFCGTNLQEERVDEAIALAENLCSVAEVERKKLEKWRAERKEQEDDLRGNFEAAQDRETRHEQVDETPQDGEVTERSHEQQIRNCRMERVGREPDVGVMVVLRTPDGPNIKRMFTMGAFCQEVYDWAGSREELPLHFTLHRGSTIVRHGDKLQFNETLNITERDEKEVVEMLKTEVSFRGNIAAVPDLSETVEEEQAQHEAKDRQGGKRKRKQKDSRATKDRRKKRKPKGNKDKEGKLEDEEDKVKDKEGKLGDEEGKEDNENNSTK